MLQDKSTISPNKKRNLGRYALILMLNGKGFYRDETGLNRELQAGDAIWVAPDCAHAYGSIDGKAWGQIYVVFSGPQFDLLQQSESYHAHQPVWHLEPVDLWRRRLEEIFQPTPTRSPIEELQAIGRFSQLLIDMATTDAAARLKPGDTWLEESLHLLSEPYKEGWIGPHSVARQVGMSYESFRKRFSARTGQAPGKFQQQRRVDLACAAIYRGNTNFKELAEELGFCDVYHFSKVFRQIVGSPPSAYRRTVRGG